MRMIDADYLIKEFADRARAARNWKESALNSGNEESAIRADAVLSFLTEVKLTIDDALTVNDKAYAIENIVAQAWERGYKYGLYEAEQKKQVKVLIGGEQVYPNAKEADNEPL